MNKSKYIYKYIQQLEDDSHTLDNLYNAIIISASYKGIVLTEKGKRNILEMMVEFCEKYIEKNKPQFTENDLMEYVNIETDLSIVEGDSARGYITDFLVKKDLYLDDE